MAFVEGRSGPTIALDGAPRELRLGRLGELIDCEAVGKYYELSRNKQIYMAAMQPPSAALGTILTLTAATLTLYNPIGSGVNLSMLQCTVTMANVMQVATTTAHAFAYAVNIGPINTTPTGLTAGTVVPALLTVSGNTALTAGPSMGRVYTAATLPAVPIVARWHPASHEQFLTNTNASGGLGAVDYIDGALVLGQGTAVTLQGLSTTTGANGLVSFTWAEIPV